MERGASESLFRIGVLLAGDRRRGDAAAVMPCGMFGKAAPAAADFEHVILRRQLQLAANTIVLFDRRLFQC